MPIKPGIIEFEIIWRKVAVICL